MMKRRFVFQKAKTPALLFSLLCFVLLFSGFCFPAAAKEPFSTQAQAINRYLSDEDVAWLQKAGVDLETTPVFRRFIAIPYGYAGKALPDILAENAEDAQGCNFLEYCVWEETPYWLWIGRDTQEIVRKETLNPSGIIRDGVPAFMEDLAKALATGEVRAIGCLDACDSHFGTVLYVQTEAETTVRYYDLPQSEATVYTEEAFASYALPYYEYLTSREYNYDENGHQLYGNALPFAEFVKTLGAAASPKNPTNEQWIGFVAAGSICLVLIAAAVLYLRKKAAAKK